MIMMCWSFRKFFTNLKSSLETFLFFMSCKSLLCITLLNAFFSFKLSNETTLLFMSLHTVCIFFIINCKVVFIDLCLQALIWMFNIESQAFITFYRCSNTMNFNILLNVLNNTIDLYIFNLSCLTFALLLWLCFWTELIIFFSVNIFQRESVFILMCRWWVCALFYLYILCVLMFCQMSLCKWLF